jgi:hypothetical protein
MHPKGGGSCRSNKLETANGNMIKECKSKSKEQQMRRKWSSVMEKNHWHASAFKGEVVFENWQL